MAQKNTALHCSERSSSLVRILLVGRALVVELDDARRDLLVVLLDEERQQDRVEQLAALVPCDAAVALRPALHEEKERGVRSGRQGCGRGREGEKDERTLIPDAILPGTPGSSASLVTGTR